MHTNQEKATMRWRASASTVWRSQSPLFRWFSSVQQHRLPTDHQDSEQKEEPSYILIFLNKKTIEKIREFKLVFNSK